MIQEKVNIEVGENVINVDYLVAKVISTAGIDVIHSEVGEPSTVSDISSSSSENSMSEDNSTLCGSDIEKDGFNYLCGWLAQKFKNKYSFLGLYTNDLPRKNHEYSLPGSWVQHLSFGGLTEPSQDWVEKAFLLERHFKKCTMKMFVEKQVLSRS